MTSQLWQEWTGQWPLPGVAVALVGVFLALRVALPVAERGRVRAGILFCGAYLALLFAIALLAEPAPTTRTITTGCASSRSCCSRSRR